LSHAKYKQAPLDDGEIKNVHLERRDGVCLPAPTN